MQYILAVLWPPSKKAGRPLALLFGPQLTNGELTAEKLLCYREAHKGQSFRVELFSAESKTPRKLRVTGSLPSEYGLWLDSQGDDPFTFEVQEA